ncbi:hypothetical protein Rsub_13098 [Raphidocelis subcapitata]|uniref:Peroxisomal membrane protein n=1 Tax=Raphidocelis subcapitata TaxID=307507 RepID=A0A2V0PRW3_9CHLO|nr:hypothetical protein Rsub_13098 [Raphidocelis subcapitata]|eukprot:GBG00328.1 hypothetical protein Rsub_13098 [Raphidocelis subcapitata]
MAAPAGLLAGLTAPLRAVGRAYNAHAQRRPFAVGTVTTVVKTSAADAFAQLVLEDTPPADFDWKRHGLFCGFGLVYLGGFQYYLYNHLFVRWCAPITAAVGHKGAAPVKTFIDQAIHHPFCYFPVFYGLKGAVEGRPLASTWGKYKADLWDNCKALWTIWVPAQLVNFAFVPRHLRIPYVAGVSFAWTVVLSAMRGALKDGAAPTTQQLADAVDAVAAAAAATTPAGAALAEAPEGGDGGSGGGGGGGGGARAAPAAAAAAAAGGAGGLKALAAQPGRR